MPNVFKVIFIRKSLLSWAVVKSIFLFVTLTARIGKREKTKFGRIDSGIGVMSESLFLDVK